MQPIDCKGKMVELEGLRGIAILLVTVHHFWPLTQGDAYAASAPLAHLGWIGVELFFVISGCLIGGILLDTKGEPGYFRNFYMRRVLRIFPLYYAVVLSLFIVVPLGQALLHGGGYRDSEFIRESGNPLWYLLYAGNVREAITGVEPAYFLAPLWSVSIEEQFYLLCPLLIQRLDAEGVRRVLLLLFVGAPLFRLAMYLLFPENERIQYLSTLSRLDNLGAGLWLALMLRSGSAIDARRLSLLLASLTLAGIAIYACGGFDRNGFFCRIFGYSFLALYFAVLVLWALRLRGARAAGWLRVRWLVWLGSLCYGLYILQRPAEIALGKGLALLAIDLEAYPTTALLAKFAFAIVVAQLSFRFFESPINRLKEKYASQHHPLQGAAAPAPRRDAAQGQADPAGAG